MQGLSYNVLDRSMHRVAFRARFLREMLCDLELQLNRKEIGRQVVDRPVFVTGLPRAGTTLILEVLAKHPDVVTHTYRDMPFVLSPVIWDKLSKRFQAEQAKRERSHSDGMLVNVDSPEAFEEVLWMQEFPQLFASDGLRLSRNDGPEVREKLSDLIRRLLVARGTGTSTARRYVSKNNANISRVPSLRAAFPDARFLVPLRNPIDHAMSLLSQHRRFLAMHAQTGFSQQYMKDIGHFEFGALHRPILFDGMKEVMATHDPATLAYWVAYWICAHRAIAERTDAAILDMAQFTAAPDVAGLCAMLDLSKNAPMIAASEQLIRPIKRYEMPEMLPGALRDEALSLYDTIRAKSH